MYLLLILSSPALFYTHRYGVCKSLGGFVCLIHYHAYNIPSIAITILQIVRKSLGGAEKDTLLPPQYNTSLDWNTALQMGCVHFGNPNYLMTGSYLLSY